MPPIILSKPEQAELDKLVRRLSTPQQLVLRARIILAAAHGHTQGEIVRQLSITKDTVRRWLALQTSQMSNVLGIAPRPFNAHMQVRKRDRP